MPLPQDNGFGLEASHVNDLSTVSEDLFSDSSTYNLLRDSYNLHSSSSSYLASASSTVEHYEPSSDAVSAYSDSELVLPNSRQNVVQSAAVADEQINTQLDLEIDIEELAPSPSSAIQEVVQRVASYPASSSISEEIFWRNVLNLTPYTRGVFTVGETGQVKIDYLFDGGGYGGGQVAIVNLDGMEALVPGSSAFNKEAAYRALSNSELGYVVINDEAEGARFSGILGTSDGDDFNQGSYIGPKTFKMAPGSLFMIMIVPDGKVQEVFDNPGIDGSKRPLYSLTGANPDGTIHIGQLLDVFGDGTTFGMEDLRTDTGSDMDGNDFIFKIEGAKGYAPLLSDFINPANDWCYSQLGQEIFAYVSTNDNPNKGMPGEPVRDPILPLPQIPLTLADQGGNSLSNPTLIVASSTQDVIDQVTNADPTDIYRVAANSLSSTQFTVLSGLTTVSFLSSTGQVLGSQVFGKGTHTLALPGGLAGDIFLKIDNRDNSVATYVLQGFASKAAEPFNIDIDFGDGVTTSQQSIIRAAAKSIESMIKQGLPSAIVDGRIIDDINVKFSLNNLDGVGGTLAQTKIDFMRYGTLLPAQSIVQMDGSDIAELERSGRLFNVVQHEFLHALGFGNLWEAKGLVDYAKTPFSRYTGQSAIAAFKEAGGSTDFISLETVGDGSADLHWSEGLFGDEVMTKDLNSQGRNATVSKITLASLVDLGYQVNFDQATPNWSLVSNAPPDAESIFSEEDKQRLAELIAVAEAQPSSDIPTIIAPVDPATISPTIWAHAERFDVNGEYYDWELITVGNWRNGHTVWNYVRDRMTHPSKLDNRSVNAKANDSRYWQFIVDRNRAFGIERPQLIYENEQLYLPVWNQNYEQEQEEERKRREAELRAKEEEEKRQREKLEEAYRQSGQGGLEWYLSKPLPDFGPTAPYETSVRDLVGSLVPDDYFRFTVSRPGYVTLYLEDLLADVDLYLYDSKNRLIAKSTRGGITDEKIIANLAAGTYLARVHSPVGITTDYNLRVRFDGIPSRTQAGNGSSSGKKGPTFSDPRIERVFRNAIDKFTSERWAQAQPQINQLNSQKQQKQAELNALLAQAIAEQRAKIYAQLDGVRNNIQGQVSGGANNVRNVINGVADGAISTVNSLVPGWLKDILDRVGLGDDVQNAKNSLRGVINDARNWLNGQVDSVRNQINGAVGQFIEMVKSAYMTGGEINQAIENAANWLKGETDRLANFLNDKIGEFKGQILGKLEWTRNIRIPDWARSWPINAPDWNLYDHAIVGMVNNLAGGASNAINGVSNFFKDTVSVVKPLAQGAVATIVDALFGDRTGKLYNEINGIDQQIANIRAGVEQAINNQTARFKADLEKMLGDLGREGKKIFDTLMDFSNSPTAQIGMAVLEVILGLIPGVGQAIDIKDTALSLNDILIQGKRGIGDFVGLIGSLAGWVPGVGDAIKSVAKIALRGADLLVPILKNLGPDVTETVIKTISELDWGKLLTDVVNDIARRWDDVVRVLDRTAGWILDGLNVRPVMELAGAAMFKFREGADDVAVNLKAPAKQLQQSTVNAAKRILWESWNRNRGSLRQNLGNPVEVNIPGTNYPYPSALSGNLSKDYQAHHLITIPNNPDEVHDLLRIGSTFGYDINNAKNGIFLPTTIEQANLIFQTSGIRLPVHSGGHKAYSDFIRDQMDIEWIELSQRGLTNDREAILRAIDSVTQEAKNTVLNRFSKIE